MLALVIGHISTFVNTRHIHIHTHTLNHLKNILRDSNVEVLTLPNLGKLFKVIPELLPCHHLLQTAILSEGGSEIL